MNKPKESMDYFPHSTTQNESDEIKKLRMKAKQNFCEAYGLYMILLEKLARKINEESLVIDNEYLELLAYDLNIDIDKMKKYLELYQALSILSIQTSESNFIISDDFIKATKKTVIDRRDYDKMRKQESNFQPELDNFQPELSKILLREEKRKEKKIIENNSKKDNKNIIFIEKKGKTTTTTIKDKLVRNIVDRSLNLTEDHIHSLMKWTKENRQVMEELLKNLQDSGKNSVNFVYLVKARENILESQKIENKAKNEPNTSILESNLTAEQEAEEFKKLQEQRRARKLAKANNNLEQAI